MATRNVIKINNAEEFTFVARNGQAIIDLAIEFYNDLDCEDDTEYYFPGYTSAFIRVYNERLGYEIKEFTTQVTQYSNTLVLNLSEDDMTFEDNGKYYYEIGYYQNSVYDIVLAYGEFRVV